MGNIKGKDQSVNTFKYLLYLYCLFRECGFYPPFSSVGIKHKEIQKDFGMSNNTHINNQFLGKGTIKPKLLTVVDENTHNNTRSYRYSLISNNYLKLLEKFENSSLKQKEKIFEYIYNKHPNIKKHLPYVLNPYNINYSFEYETKYFNITNKDTSVNISNLYDVYDICSNNPSNSILYLEEPCHAGTLPPLFHNKCIW